MGHFRHPVPTERRVLSPGLVIVVIVAAQLYLRYLNRLQTR